MAELLKGKEAAAAIRARTQAAVQELKQHGITPQLAILRVGENESDISYEKGASKRCADAGIEVKYVTLPRETEQEEFDGILQSLNEDDSVHGILMFRPLPKRLDSEKARKMIAFEKDIDGCTDASLTGIFINKPQGFAPCTAQAAIEILDAYGIEIKGKNIAVVGRSLVVGKPLSMMLLNRNATVTICHTRTVDLPSVTRKADIVIAAAGQPEMLGKEYFSEGQTVIDVGISWNEKKGKLCGDVLFEEVEPIVRYITPVPGGVGSVTSTVLADHVAQAAKRQYEKK